LLKAIVFLGGILLLSSFFLAKHKGDILIPDFGNQELWQVNHHKSGQIDLSFVEAQSVMINTDQSKFDVTFTPSDNFELNLYEYDQLYFELENSAQIKSLIISFENPNASRALVWNYKDFQVGRRSDFIKPGEQTIKVDLFLTQNRGVNLKEIARIRFTMELDESIATQAAVIKIKNPRLADDPHQMNLGESDYKNSKLPVYRLKISDKKLEQLNEDLPDSGWSWVDVDLEDLTNKKEYQKKCRN